MIAALGSDHQHPRIFIFEKAAVNMGALPSPLRFDFANPETWNKWIPVFEVYSFAYSLFKAP